MCACAGEKVPVRANNNGECINKYMHSQKCTVNMGKSERDNRMRD